VKILLVGDEYPPRSSRGLAKYIYMLAKEYRKLGHEVELVIRRERGVGEEWISQVYSPALGRGTWKVYPFFAVPKLLKEEADVFHSNYVNTGVPLIISGKKPSIVSIHDVNPLVFPEWNHPLSVAYYKFCFKFAERADALVVVSNYSKKEVLEYTEIPEEKIHVVYNGVDHEIFYPQEKREKPKFVFSCLSGLGRWKNVGTLIKAFHELHRDHDDVELRIGGTGVMEGELKRLVQQLGVKDVIFEGFVPEEKINEFYNRSDCFVFPSLYEGFGLPILEAMACGVPVISSKAASLPEVGGGAAVYFDPNNVEELAGMMESLLADEGLRMDLANKGIDRSRQFSWGKTAEKTLEIYEQVRK
jgi:glycosyltransferase involved in cell wall biosynthesis